MANRTVIQFVHRSIAEDVSRAFEFDVSFATRVELFDGDPKALFERLAQEPTVYALVFAPPEWQSLAPDIPTEVFARLESGLLRLVIWNALNAPAWGVPFTRVPSTLIDSTKRLVLDHLTRRPTWGVQAMLPARSRVLTERLRSESQIAQKIEESIRFVSTLTPAFDERTMALRLALTVLFDTALGAPERRAGKKPATYQIAVAGDALVCSVRFVAPELSLASWSRPEIAWRMLFGSARASFVIVSPPSGEVEITLVFGPDRPAARGGETPLVVDVLTSARQALAADLSELTDLDFEYFTQQLEPEDAATFVSASQASNPGLELAGLRVEYHKLGLQLKQAQEVSSDHLRRMAQALEAEKVAHGRIQNLTVQLEYAAQKEAELTRKLQSAMDQYLTLKLAKTGKKKAG